MRGMRMLAAAMLVMVATTAQAQGGGQAGQAGGQAPQGGGMGQGAGRMNEMLWKDITLTPEQKTKIDSIQAAGRTAMQAMMQSGGMQDPANREKAMEMRRKQAADVRAVLTPEQQAIYDKNLAAMPQGGGRRPPPMGK